MHKAFLRTFSRAAITGLILLGGHALAAGDDMAFPDSEMPNGSMKECKLGQKPADLDGQRVIVITWYGMIYLALPAVTDWKFQCDDERFFWALSKSARMQVTVNPRKPKPGEDVSYKNYLSALGANQKKGIESHGARVTDPVVFSISKDDKGEIFGLEMTINAPEGQRLPLFPQDSFFTTRMGPGGNMFDLHFTTYSQEGENKKALTEKVHALLGSFIIKGDAGPKTDAQTPVADLTKPSKSNGPLPSFPGISSANFSDKTTEAMKAVLDCKSEKMGRYCDALDRFVKAKPLSKDANNVWAGSTLVVFAADGGKIAGAGEGVHHLYVKKGKASFNAVKPSDESEAKDLRVLLDQVHAGKAPARDSGLMKYLGGFTPMQTNPVEVKAGALSFIMGIGADLGAKEDQLPEAVRSAPRDFVRENDKELLVVEVWGEGTAIKIGIFPKG
jgi:hypothetical protein